MSIKRCAGCASTISIPEDISLRSFDDVPAFSVHRPGITAVGRPVDKSAEQLFRS